MWSKKVTDVTKSSIKLLYREKPADYFEINIVLNRFGLQLEEICSEVVSVDYNVTCFRVR